MEQPWAAIRRYKAIGRESIDMLLVDMDQAVVLNKVKEQDNPVIICKYCGKKYHIQKKDANTWKECYCSQQCYDVNEKELLQNSFNMEIPRR